MLRLTTLLRAMLKSLHKQTADKGFIYTQNRTEAEFKVILSTILTRLAYIHTCVYIGIMRDWKTCIQVSAELAAPFPPGVEHSISSYYMLGTALRADALPAPSAYSRQHCRVSTPSHLSIPTFFFFLTTEEGQDLLRY